MALNIYWWQSLKIRVTLFALAIFLISIWSLAFYAGGMLRADMQRLLGEQQFSTTSILANGINGELKDRIDALEKVAKAIDASLLAKPAALEKLLGDRPILQILFNGGTFATGLDGTAIADYPVVAGRVGTNYIDRESIAVPLREGKSVIGRPAMGKTLGAPIFSIVVPIRDFQGKVIGALCATVNLGIPNFLDKVTRSHHGNTSEYLLVAPQHRLVVTATDQHRVMTAVRDPGSDPLVDRFMQGYEGTGILVNLHGEEMLASAKGIAVAGWYLVATLPTVEAFGPIREMRMHLLLATLLLTLLTGGVTWWILIRQLAPILATVKRLTALSDTNQPWQSLPIARRDEIGELIGGFNRLLDVLARREDALKKSEVRHRTILQTAIDGFWLVDAQGRLIEVNETYCQMSGYSERELLTMRIADLEAAESADDAAAHMQKIMAQGNDRFQSLHRRKDGSVFDVEVSVQFRSSEGGWFSVFVQDISERKRAESELRESEARFRSLTEMSTDFYWESDAEHRLTTRTESKREAAEGVFRLASPIGLRRWEYSSLAPDQAGWAAHRAVLDAHLPFRDFEISRLRANGAVHHIAVNGDPVFDAAGNFKGYRGAGADITERKQAEAEIRRINSELEQRVEQRTHELRVAIDELESFSYSVSHDLRAPLRAIEGFSSLLEKEYAAVLDERARDYFKRVRGGAARMACLIDDLLKLSRISRQELHRGPVDLSALAREAAEELQAAEPGRRVEWVIAPDISANGDPGLLRIALQNLIGNAWKYSSKSENARIEFGIGESGGRPAYFVRDNGAGFDMAYADKLFGAFQRLHSPGEFPGSGIGLATVKRIIHRHGREISAEGKPGDGATFYFTL